jgi:hypothetical protein
MESYATRADGSSSTNSTSRVFGGRIWCSTSALRRRSTNGASSCLSLPYAAASETPFWPSADTK